MSTPSPSFGDDDAFAFASDHRGTGPWHQLRRRVEPLLGDLEMHLGQGWHIALDQLFSDVDLRVANQLKTWKGGEKRWFAVQGFNIDGLAREFLDLMCTESFDEAVAILIEECRSGSTLPTSLSIDAARGELDIWLGAQLMASVRPMAIQSVKEEHRRRAEGTIIGLRKFANPDHELLKRARRWPGLADIEGDGQGLIRGKGSEVPFPSAEVAHHPVPKEWLLSVSALCARCGQPDPDRRFLENVAAAAFNAPSWHHLTREGGKTSAIAGSWAITFSDGTTPGEQVRGFYVDGIDAVADLLSRAPVEFIKGWPGVQIGFTSSSSLPAYVLQRPSSVQELQEEFGPSVWATPLRTSMPVRKDVSQDVRRALAEPDTRALESLFGIGRPLGQRMSLLDSWAGEQLVASEGSWRFTLTGSDRDSFETRAFRARRYDPDGSCAENAAVSAYKGQLRSWRGHQVLCGDYDGSRPEAIIDGLSNSTLSKLRAVLPDQDHEVRSAAAWPTYAEPPHGPYADRHFARLVARFETRRRRLDPK